MSLRTKTKHLHVPYKDRWSITAQLNYMYLNEECTVVHVITCTMCNYMRFWLVFIFIFISPLIGTRGNTTAQ